MGGEPSPPPTPRRQATKIPLDWQPGETARRWLAEHGVSDAAASPLIADFRAYWIARGDRRADWDLTFIRNPPVKGAIARMHQQQQPRGNPNARPRTLTEQAADAESAYYERANASSWSSRS